MLHPHQRALCRLVSAALPFWHDMDGRDLSDRGYVMKDCGPMEMGDVSWHHGWVLHCAAPQPLGTPPRLALR